MWLSTVDHDGRPNVSPNEVFFARGDRVVIAHIASPRPVRNIRANPHVCVAVVDVFEQVGHQLSGTAQIVPSDPHPLRPSRPGNMDQRAPQRTRAGTLPAPSRSARG